MDLSRAMNRRPDIDGALPRLSRSFFFFFFFWRGAICFFCLGPGAPAAAMSWHRHRHPHEPAAAPRKAADSGPDHDRTRKWHPSTQSPNQSAFYVDTNQEILSTLVYNTRVNAQRILFCTKGDVHAFETPDRSGHRQRNPTGAGRWPPRPSLPRPSTTRSIRAARGSGPRSACRLAMACGDDRPAIADAAASAIELIHCASLVA